MLLQIHPVRLQVKATWVKRTNLQVCLRRVTINNQPPTPFVHLSVPMTISTPLPKACIVSPLRYACLLPAALRCTLAFGVWCLGKVVGLRYPCLCLCVSVRVCLGCHIYQQSCILFMSLPHPPCDYNWTWFKCDKSGYHHVLHGSEIIIIVIVFGLFFIS